MIITVNPRRLFRTTAPKDSMSPVSPKKQKQKKAVGRCDFLELLLIFTAAVSVARIHRRVKKGDFGIFDVLSFPTQRSSLLPSVALRPSYSVSALYPTAPPALNPSPPLPAPPPPPVVLPLPQPAAAGSAATLHCRPISGGGRRVRARPWQLSLHRSGRVRPSRETGMDRSKNRPGPVPRDATVSARLGSALLGSARPDSARLSPRRLAWLRTTQCDASELSGDGERRR